MEAPASTLPPVERYCAEVQHLIAGTSLPVVNVVHPDYTAFVKSKPKIRPLETEQYTTLDDAGRPKIISCKMKTVDHLKAEYGEAAAGEDASCAAWNRRTWEAVLTGFTDKERRGLRFDEGRDVVFDLDVVTNQGQIWVLPFPIARVDPDGALHLLSKSMKNDWTDPRYADAPVLVRGTRYCHLVAPDYLRGLLLGEITLP